MRARSAGLPRLVLVDRMTRPARACSAMVDEKETNGSTHSADETDRTRSNPRRTDDADATSTAPQAPPSADDLADLREVTKTGRLARSCPGGGGLMGRWCRATLTYVGAAGVRQSRRVEVGIHDGRAAALPGWEVCGFELVPHGSAVRDWHDDEEVAATHYAEAEHLARRLTGADVALVSDHVRRSAAPHREAREQAPVGLVHSDFAPNYADVVRYSYRDVRGRGLATLARNAVGTADIEGAARIVMLQIWRNVGPPRMDFPVAFCDARTVRPDETVPFRYTGYVAGGRSFDALAVVAPHEPDRHRWYTFPAMNAQEVVAFRTYDTQLVGTGTTYFTPHSAFRDPQVPVGDPPRTSIELRVMCLFLD